MVHHLDQIRRQREEGAVFRDADIDLVQPSQQIFDGVGDGLKFHERPLSFGPRSPGVILTAPSRCVKSVVGLY